MKRFKTNSIIFIFVIVLIFMCNVYYLIALYNSMRDAVERDVMTALADADFDELWARTENAQAVTNAEFDSDQSVATPDEGEFSAGRDTTENVVVTKTRHPDGTVSSDSIALDENNYSATNIVVDAIGKQFHAIVDPYIGPDLPVMDSLFTRQLNSRYIHPDFVAVEIIDSTGAVVQHNPKIEYGDYDTFVHCFNPAAGSSYRACITPLTKHVLSQMTGVIVTVFLLMIAFATAFCYLFRTVSRLRTIEEMKDDFVGNMTHELKTPLAIAYSANDALLHYDTANDPGKKEAYLSIAIKQLGRLSELVEGILSMSMERRKNMILHTERFQLSPLVNELAAAQRMRTEKMVSITVEVPDGIYVTADKTHLSNVINNLVDNAIKYSGASVDINIAADADGISVKDNGIGIPARNIPYIFNKFYRVPHGNVQDVRGYGIGLYYVKSILEKMGWDIAVRSKYGHGSIFTIKFNDDEK